MHTAAAETQKKASPEPLLPAMSLLSYWGEVYCTNNLWLLPLSPRPAAAAGWVRGDSTPHVVTLGGTTAAGLEVLESKSISLTACSASSPCPQGHTAYGDTATAYGDICPLPAHPPLSGTPPKTTILRQNSPMSFCDWQKGIKKTRS